MSYTVPEIIQIAKICVPLTCKAIATGAEKDKRLPRKLYIGWNVVSDIYNDTPNSTDLPLMANYLFSMCQGYAFQAEGYIGTGGGTVINPGSNLTYRAYSYGFVVGQTGALVLDGGTTFTINIGLGATLYPNFTLDIDQTPSLPINDPNYACFTAVYSSSTGLVTVTSINKNFQNTQSVYFVMNCVGNQAPSITPVL